MVTPGECQFINSDSHLYSTLREDCRSRRVQHFDERLASMVFNDDCCNDDIISDEDQDERNEVRHTRVNPKPLPVKGCCKSVEEVTSGIVVLVTKTIYGREEMAVEPEQDDGHGTPRNYDTSVAANQSTTERKSDRDESFSRQQYDCPRRDLRRKNK